MSDERYLKQLRVFYQGERFGEVMYGLAARLARSEKRREEWRSLCELEQRTKAHIEAEITERGGTISNSLFAGGLGVMLGTALGVLPERASVQLLGMLVRPAMVQFERFAKRRPDSDLARELVDHEQHQLDFVNRSLS